MILAAFFLLATSTAALAASWHNTTSSCGSYLTADEITAAEAKFEVDFAAASSVDAVTGTPRGNIPIAWHVIYKSTSVDDGYLPDSAITDSINALNTHYGGSGFSFYLTSTTRTNNSTWFDNAKYWTAENVDMTAALHVGEAGTLNVYTVGFSSYSGLLGYSTYPWMLYPDQDGAFILHSTVPGGSFQNYNQGKTLTHEVGHWLGLYHTFEGGCDGDGDYVSDTPPQDTATGGCPVGKDSCPGGGLDLIQNYMDYSFDSCRGSFTIGQMTRAISQWTTYRGI